jgi:hypothetical protein
MKLITAVADKLDNGIPGEMDKEVGKTMEIRNNFVPGQWPDR